MTCATFPSLSHLASQPSNNEALRHSLDTSAPSLLAFVGNLTSLELYKAPCWLGTNNAALWASMRRLTELAVCGPDLLIDLRLQVRLRNLPTSLLRLDLGRLRLGRSSQMLAGAKEALDDGLPSMAKLQVLTMPSITSRAAVLVMQLAGELAALARERDICVIESSERSRHRCLE